MISQTAEYALRAVVFLATNNESPISRVDIASATKVPADYLTKVLQDLDRAGIVRSRRGPGGGYTLEAPPDTTSVFEIINVVSTVPRIEKCPLGIAEHVKLCPLHKRLDEAAELVERAFRGTMISELIPTQSTRASVNRAANCRFPRLE